MVQSIKEIIELDNFDEIEFTKVLETFVCDRDEDVRHFLLNSAVSLEKTGEARTFLILDDDKWKIGEVCIEGFFSLALKPLSFKKEMDKNIIKSLFGKSRSVIPAYLLGQLAKRDGVKKGAGKEYLDFALSKIRVANDQVGGKFIYLDCKKSLQTYYENYGFKFFQYGKNDLVQMYMTI